MAPRLTDRQRLDRSVRERDLQAVFMDAARLLGWHAMHISDSRRITNRGGRTEVVGDSDCKGWPDLFLAHPPSGRLMAVEVKVEDPNRGKVSPEQQVWLDALAACGVEAFVLRPSGLDAAIARLRRQAA